MHILEELWNGNLCPISQQHYRSADYRHFVDLYERMEDKLLSTMNAGQKEDLQKMQNFLEEMRNIAECNAFMTGFRLAVQLISVSAGDL